MWKGAFICDLSKTVIHRFDSVSGIHDPSYITAEVKELFDIFEVRSPDIYGAGIFMPFLFKLFKLRSCTFKIDDLVLDNKRKGLICVSCFQKCQKRIRMLL